MLNNYNIQVNPFVIFMLCTVIVLDESCCRFEDTQLHNFNLRCTLGIPKWYEDEPEHTVNSIGLSLHLVKQGMLAVTHMQRVLNSLSVET